MGDNSTVGNFAPAGCLFGDFSDFILRISGCGRLVGAGNGDDGRDRRIGGDGGNFFKNYFDRGNVGGDRR